MKKLILALLILPFMQMSYADDKEKKDPKVGEQATTSSSAINDSSRGTPEECVKRRQSGC